MAKWKYELTNQGIKFSGASKYRGEIITKNEIPNQHRVELARILLRIINSFHREDKEDE